jgi:hypothetical protein
MFTREEASRTREEFWTAFGRYMSPVPAADGTKINWINYRTEIKDLYFRMDANQTAAMISIPMEHSDPGIRELYFQQWEEFKSLLHATLQEEWEWQLHARPTEEKVISRVYKQITGVSVFNKDHWPELISFFKPRIIALDLVWEDAKYSFVTLK